MGACASSSSIPEQPLAFGPEDQAKAYDTIFKTVVNMAMELQEIEMITRQALSPPCEEIVLGLCGVAAIDIAASQINNAHGIVIVPGSGETITRANCPPYLKGVIEPLILMKDELKKINQNGEVIVGDINRIKQVLLFAYTDTPVRIWGSSLQKYEAVADLARQAADATKRLPEFTTRSALVAEEIQAAVQNQVFEVNKKKLRGNAEALGADDDDDSDDDGSRMRPKPKPMFSGPPSQSGPSAPAPLPSPPAAPVPAASSEVEPTTPKDRANHINAIIREQLEDVEEDL